MASISESSVVIAIRDWQWLLAKQRAELNRNAASTPTPYIGLSKQAEYKLGDFITEQDDRLFLFEVKSTKEKINDEWSAPEKHAYRAITKWVGNCVSKEPERRSSTALRRLRRSVQCHHFVYFEPDTQATDICSGGLMIMPYIGGLLSRCTNLTWKLIRKSWEEEFGIGVVAASQPQDPSESIRFRSRAAVSLHSIADARVRLIDRTAPGEATWDFLGLPLKEFQLYVNSLCGKTPEPLHAVVLSSSGQFFAHITSTAELSALFSAQPNSPTPTSVGDSSLPEGFNKDEEAPQLATKYSQPRPRPNGPRR